MSAGDNMLQELNKLITLLKVDWLFRAPVAKESVPGSFLGKGHLEELTDKDLVVHQASLSA